MNSKNLTNLLLLNLIILILYSCSKGEMHPDTQLVKEFHNTYMSETAIWKSSNMPRWPRAIENNPNYFVEYNGDKPNRLIGGTINTAAMMTESFTNCLYKQVTYKGDKVIIEEQSDANCSSGEIYSPIGKSTLFYENNKLVKRIDDNHKNYEADNDTTYYEYDNKGLISKATVFCYRNIKIVNTFEFDQNNNLKKVYFKYYWYNGQEMNIEGYHEFKNYDSAENLFKNLGIFRGLYFRSLSRNNYTSYSYVVFTPHPEPPINKEWEIKYDTNNNPIYTATGFVK